MSGQQVFGAGDCPQDAQGSGSGAKCPVAVPGGPPTRPLLVNAAFTKSCLGGSRVRVAGVLESPDEGVSMIGQMITVAGWVKTIRNQGDKLSFIKLNDGSGPGDLQIVLDNKCEGFPELKTVGTGASVKVYGEIVPSKGKEQKIELLCKKAGTTVKVIGHNTDPGKYPLAKKAHTNEFLREVAHLRPRTQLFGTVTRVRSALAKATHDFFQSRGFLYIHTPLITEADCEGAGEMFQVTTLLSNAKDDPKKVALKKDGTIDYEKDFFSKPTFLTVSGQLSVENYCCSLSDVYTFGPTFRAEQSHTSRHLAEFWMIEPELAFADLNDLMDCAEANLKFCVKAIYDNHKADLKLLEEKQEPGLVARLENLLEAPFGRCSYTEAIEVLLGEEKKGIKFEVKVEWGMDLGSEHERHLCEKVHKKPTIVYNYPSGIKAFYMRRNEDGKTCAAMDILCPLVGEVVGGSVREERAEVLDKAITDLGLNTEDYWWYRDLRAYGTVPHGGYGLGFERLIMLVTGIENIRDTIPFPRYPGHAEF